MGNTSSATLRPPDGNGVAHVASDLRQERVDIPYQLATGKGRFEIPLKLGEKVVALPDAAELARSGALEVTTFPIDLEENRVLSEGHRRTRRQCGVGRGGGGVGAGGGMGGRVGARGPNGLGPRLLTHPLTSPQGVPGRGFSLILDRKNWIGRKRSWVIGQRRRVRCRWP